MGACCSTFLSAANEVVERLGVEKALDPNRRRDFLVIQNALTRSLRRAAGGDEANALRTAIQRLDVDWGSMRASQRDSVVDAALSSIRGVGDRVAPRVGARLSGEAPRIMRAARGSTDRRMNLGVGSSLTLRDERAGRILVDSNILFVRDEYGRRQVRYSEVARNVVRNGLDRGLGRDEIAEKLDEALGDTRAARDMSYWRVTAGAFTGHARTQSNLNAFDDAGITRYRFEAVLDEATSEICRFMHGRVFEVRPAIQRYEAAAELDDPEDIRELMPWSSMRTDSRGNAGIFIEQGGRERRIAQVDRPGMGARDRVGSYSRQMSDAQLAAAGVMVPPLHGNCRSTIIAEV